ncbi:MCR-9 family phosphoethanolamine--lipid A transferase [Enterobacter kobei]|uniref:MCR-9 family phosphoethanolamine--lipid A transferase n=2 Tax=Enterobacter kobei TaxID=208224 RepID=UPI000DCD04CF|nr:MCR-9 family phosphoethanolamine--lipid A transferase [Enterobacter kobei]RAY64629.1 phosphoethanolamine transferase [Enterobacter kobei]
MPVLFRVKVIPLVLLLAMIFAFLLNLPILLHFYEILSHLEHVKIGFVISIPFVLVAALNVVFMPFSVRFLLKPFFALLFITGSLVSYSTLKYKVMFDQTMIQNIIETNPQEAHSYLNGSIIIWFVFTGILPAILLFSIKIQYPEKWYKGIAYRLLSVLASLSLIAGVAALYYQDYASVGRNNSTLNKEIIPANYAYSTFQYVKDTYFTTKVPFQTLGNDAKRVVAHEKPTLMFLVIGETARSQNFSMNGYSRDTNAFTSKSGGVISFKNMHSCGTATAISVPCMFSNMNRTEYDSKKASNSENFLDIVQKTGVSLLWKENDGGCKGVCSRIPTVEIKPSDNPKLCDGKTCHDEVMLENLDDEIAKMLGDKLVAFHIIGSHGPTYYLRYPAEHRHFMPECARSDIENCTQEQLVNTYDNTLRYTDYVLAEMIEKLKNYSDQYNTVLLYVSDHGESLGESGLYLHGTPYKLAPDQQTHIPMQVWMSPGFIAGKHINMSCLENNAAKKSYSHDNLFSSILGLWDVSTSVYNPDRDLFRECRG